MASSCVRICNDDHTLPMNRACPFSWREISDDSVCRWSCESNFLSNQHILRYPSLHVNRKKPRTDLHGRAPKLRCHDVPQLILLWLWICSGSTVRTVAGFLTRTCNRADLLIIFNGFSRIHLCLTLRYTGSRIGSIAKELTR